MNQTTPRSARLDTLAGIVNGRALNAARAGVRQAWRLYRQRPAYWTAEGLRAYVSQEVAVLRQVEARVIREAAEWGLSFEPAKPAQRKAA